jgi:hypothetical protein
MPDSDEPKELTVDSIRDCLRSSIFDVIFTTKMYEIEGMAKEVEAGKIIADNFIRFGLNARLIEMDEAKDWKNGIDEKQMLPEICKKWCRDYPNRKDNHA